VIIRSVPEGSRMLTRKEPDWVQPPPSLDRQVTVEPEALGALQPEAFVLKPPFMTRLAAFGVTHPEQAPPAHPARHGLLQAPQFSLSVASTTQLLLQTSLAQQIPDLHWPTVHS